MQKSAGKVLPSIFWDQDGILLIHYLPKGQTIKAKYYSSLSRHKWMTFWRKKCCGKVTNGGLVLAQQCPGSRRNCNPEETGVPGLTMSLSPTLFSGSGPIRLKNQLKGCHFSSDAEVIATTETWLDRQLSEFFSSGLQKLEQQAKKCIELHGENVE